MLPNPIEHTIEAGAEHFADVLMPFVLLIGRVVYPLGWLINAVLTPYVRWMERD
jgi:hypothetical protein